MDEHETVSGGISEKDVTRTIVSEFSAQFDAYIESDVVIVGAGPSGLVCGRDLATKGLKVLIVERNNYLGGGFWIGGYLMNKVTFIPAARAMVEELEVPYKTGSAGLLVTDGPHVCSKLIAAACDAGVKFANMTMVDDVVVRADKRVAGVVINWSPIKALPRQITCVDPVALETRVVVDATGHDAVVAQLLAKQGLVALAGGGPMWVERSEQAVVEHTGLVHPGLVIIGMAVSTFFGLPRMGPTFGGMLLSGRRGAECVLAEFEQATPEAPAVLAGQTA